MTLGQFEGRDIIMYDVVQISRDGGVTWEDYASITSVADAQYARKLLQTQGGWGSHPIAKYRLK